MAAHGEPCRRCGDPIRRRIQGPDARVTFWCRLASPCPTAPMSMDELKSPQIYSTHYLLLRALLIRAELQRGFILTNLSSGVALCTASNFTIVR